MLVQILKFEGFFLTGMKNNISYGDNKIKSNGRSKDKKCHNDSNSPRLRVSESHARDLLRPSTAPSNGDQTRI